MPSNNRHRVHILSHCALTHLSSTNRALEQPTSCAHTHALSHCALTTTLHSLTHTTYRSTHQVRFPAWPISNHIQLLKDVLDQWKIEVEKKPETMSMEEAYETLGLDASEGEIPQAKIRKAYFKMSMKCVAAHTHTHTHTHTRARAHTHTHTLTHTHTHTHTHTVTTTTTTTTTTATTTTTTTTTHTPTHIITSTHIHHTHHYHCPPLPTTHPLTHRHPYTPPPPPPASRYHPDKNPEGRDMFEKVNKSYEYVGTPAQTITTIAIFALFAMCRARSLTSLPAHSYSLLTLYSLPSPSPNSI
jgi:hypothetical protein